MKRREVLGVLGGAFAAWPLGVRAQQAGKVYRIGFFRNDNPIMGPAYNAFVEELRVQGFVEGQNLVIDQHPTGQTPAALASNVADMVRSKIDVIFTGIQPALQAAAGSGIPTHQFRSDRTRMLRNVSKVPEANIRPDQNTLGLSNLRAA